MGQSLDYHKSRRPTFLTSQSLKGRNLGAASLGPPYLGSHEAA